MATLASETSPSSPNRRGRSRAKQCERYCCRTLAHFPLLFVYGLTTWAVWVQTAIGFRSTGAIFGGPLVATLGIVLYSLANISYTTAVFTDPGSPLNAPTSSAGSYSSLPTQEPDQTQSTFTSLTAKSSGKARYCKKCQCLKPDRSHHCSTCGRCVLKMDHHCPWLATCVGLRNYKAFMLFLLYTSLFCWACFIGTGGWVWSEIINSTALEESTFVVNVILLAVLSGIIGLVLSGFTGWHLYLVIRGQTTIESLEKTRYLSPLKKSMERQIQKGRQYLGQEETGEEQSEPLIDQLKEIHANMLPGVTRPEEGEEEDSRSTTPALHSDGSPASNSLRRNYAELEEQRERDRYLEYLDEQDSEQLPHAFNLGWRKNLTNVFGSNRLLWPFPTCNTLGDGWKWEVSDEWLSKRDEVARNRIQRQSLADQRWQNGRSNGFAVQTPQGGAGRHYGAPPLVSQAGRRPPQGQNTRRSQEVALQTFDRRKQGDDGEYDTSSDEELARPRTTDWNDIPDEYLSSNNRRGTVRSQSQSRRKGD